MNILLVSPSQRFVYGENIKPPYPSIGLLMIGAVLLKINHKVKFIDIDADEINETELIYYLNIFKPDLICLTASTPTFKSARRIAKIIKKNCQAKVVLGGIHATVDPENCIGDKNIDFLIIGEGEITIKKLVNFLECDRVDFYKIKGLWYKEGNGVVKGASRDFIENIDDLPFPAWELVNDLKKYHPPGAIHDKVISIMTSRGCPFNCTFCSAWLIAGKKFRTRSKESVIEEIKYYIEKFDIQEIHIMDDVFTLEKSRAIEICQEIQANRWNLILSFANGLRVDSVDDDILQALKGAGFKDLGFGVETGDEKILKNIKKGISKDQVRRAFKLTKKYNFITWGFFIIGLPGETEESIWKTIDFAIELEPDFAKFLILKPYLGTEVYSELQKMDAIKNFNYDNYGVYSGPVHDLPDLSSDRMQLLQRRAYLKFYLRPKKIFQHIKNLKNITQIKSYLLMIKFAFIKIF